MSSESKVGGLPEATVSANEIAVMRKHVGQWVPTSNIVGAILEMKELTAVAAHLPYRSHPMSIDHGKVLDILRRIRSQGPYPDLEQCAAEITALFALAQPPPRVTQEMANSLHETAQLLDEVDRRSEARREKYGMHGQPVVDEDMVERALMAYQAVSYGCNTRALRAALTAALTGADHAHP